jgi:hypothetical protein
LTMEARIAAGCCSSRASRAWRSRKVLTARCGEGGRDLKGDVFQALAQLGQHVAEKELSASGEHLPDILAPGCRRSHDLVRPTIRPVSGGRTREGGDRGAPPSATAGWAGSGAARPSRSRFSLRTHVLTEARFRRDHAGLQRNRAA